MRRYEHNKAAIRSSHQSSPSVLPARTGPDAASGSCLKSSYGGLSSGFRRRTDVPGQGIGCQRELCVHECLTTRLERDVHQEPAADGADHREAATRSTPGRLALRLRRRGGRRVGWVIRKLLDIAFGSLVQLADLIVIPAAGLGIERLSRLPDALLQLGLVPPAAARAWAASFFAFSASDIAHSSISK